MLLINEDLLLALDMDSTMFSSQWEAVEWNLNVTNSPLFREVDQPVELALGGGGFVVVNGSEKNRAAYRREIGGLLQDSLHNEGTEDIDRQG